MRVVLESRHPNSVDDILVSLRKEESGFWYHVIPDVVGTGELSGSGVRLWLDEGQDPGPLSSLDDGVVDLEGVNLVGCVEDAFELESMGRFEEVGE